MRHCKIPILPVISSSTMPQGQVFDQRGYGDTTPPAFGQAEGLDTRYLVPGPGRDGQQVTGQLIAPGI